MCGIFGFVGVPDLDQNDIDVLVRHSQQRGKDSSGLIVHDGDNYAVYRDLVSITGQLADGTVTSHLVNWLSPLKERVTVITGERGAFVADTLAADLTFYANGSVQVIRDDIAAFRGVSEGDMIRYAIAKPEPLRVEHENFRDAVLGKDADIVTLQQGMITVVVAEAAIESARTGQTITIGNPRNAL